MTATTASGSAFDDVFGDWTPRAVVFDCDGLLLDTESVWNRTQATICARYGIELTPEEDESIVGATLEQAAEVIARAAGRDYAQVLPELGDQFEDDLSADLTVMPAARVPVACASNSWHDALVDKLTRSGLIGFFQVLHSTDTVENGKPAPDMYAAAARDLGADPAQTLGFEDSALGGRAALAAGLRLVAVPPPGGAVAGADLTLAGLDDPRLAAWIGTWSAR